MRTQTRLKLDTGGTVEEFCRLHPLATPAGTAVIERLVGLNDRGGSLAQQHRFGTLGVKSSVIEKANIRRLIRLDLESLHRLATTAATAQPEIGIRFSLPYATVNHQVFLATARSALAQAQGAVDVLLGYAMPEDLLARIAENLGRYERAVSVKDNSRAAHVGARAELDEVADDIMEVVRHLDALYSLKYRDNPELQAAWKSARNVPWPISAPPASTTPDSSAAPAA